MDRGYGCPERRGGPQEFLGCTGPMDCRPVFCYKCCERSIGIQASEPEVGGSLIAHVLVSSVFWSSFAIRKGAVERAFGQGCDDDTCDSGIVFTVVCSLGCGFGQGEGETEHCNGHQNFSSRIIRKPSTLCQSVYPRHFATRIGRSAYLGDGGISLHNRALQRNIHAARPRTLSVSREARAVKTTSHPLKMS